MNQKEGDSVDSAETVGSVGKSLSAKLEASFLPGRQVPVK